MKKEGPIGIFDSGVGGLSVLFEIKRVLPNEDMVYFADSKNCPYGTKSVDRLREVVFGVVDFLVGKRCKLIVVACNSVTATLIEELRIKYKVPFVGIEPATLVAARNTKNKKVGVLATKTTADSELFNKTKQKISPNVSIDVKVGSGLVELVERGELSGERARGVVEKNLANFKKEQVDQIVLGCTHYPFLIEVMKETFLGCEFVNPAPAVAKQVKNVLTEDENLDSKEKPSCRVYFSKQTEGLDILLKSIELDPGTVKKQLKP